MMIQLAWRWWHVNNKQRRLKRTEHSVNDHKGKAANLTLLPNFLIKSDISSIVLNPSNRQHNRYKL